MLGNSLVVQWLGLRAFTAEGLGSIPGRGTKIPDGSVPRGQKKKKRKLPISWGWRCTHPPTLREACVKREPLLPFKSPGRMGGCFDKCLVYQKLVKPVTQGPGNV